MPTGTATDGGVASELLLTLGKVAAFVALALLLGPGVVPWVLRQVARTGSRELFTLSVLAVALGIAYGSAVLFGVSFALGAFFAGVVLNESDLSHQAAANSLPLQDAFAVLFFVSVGMLFDPSIVLREPLAVAAVLALILLGKSLVAFGIVLVLGYPPSTALTVSAGLAQIGEFSFILAGLGLSMGLLPQEGRDLILAGALLSITLNPLAFAAVDRLATRVRIGGTDGGKRLDRAARRNWTSCSGVSAARETERGLQHPDHRRPVPDLRRAGPGSARGPADAVPAARRLPGEAHHPQGQPAGRRLFHLVGRGAGECRRAARSRRATASCERRWPC